MWPYSRSLDGAPCPRTSIHDDKGLPFDGSNFASQDYLGLTQHREVHHAAVDALKDFGPHSAGAAVLLGNTALSLDLERALADFVSMPQVVLFPTGWAAGFGVITALVRPYDHIVMDCLSHACLQQGASAATQNIHKFQHNSVDDARKHLRSIREHDRENGILVVTESLFSMDSDWPDIGALQQLCREHDAILLVDAAHDLGAMGPGGTGTLGRQNLVGQVDIVMGSFSKTFASNGGFIAVQSRSAKDYVRYYAGTHLFSNALSPIQCGVVLAALRIVRSDEGESRRQQLLKAIHSLRDEFRGHGVDCLGQPSPIVPVPVGSEAAARIASRLIAERGVLANLVEFPAVPLRAARFRMQVMATHSEEQAREAARIVAGSISDAKTIVNNEPAEE